MAVITQPIAHVYGAVLFVEKQSRGYSILISNGTNATVELVLPQSAQDSASNIQKGDRVLIDIEHWESRGFAHVSVLAKASADSRLLRHATSFSIGKDACQLNFSEPEKETFEERRARLGEEIKKMGPIGEINSMSDG